MAEKNKEKKPIKFTFRISWIYILLMIGIGWMFFNQGGANPQKEEWADVQKQWLDGDIQEVVFIRNEFEGRITMRPDSIAAYADKFGGQVPVKSPHFIFGMLRHVLTSCVLVYVSDVVDGSADGVDESGAASYGVVILGHFRDVRKSYSVVKHLAFVIEKHGGNVTLAILLLLLFNECVEAADGVTFKTCHGAASVKNEYKLCDAVWYDDLGCGNTAA